MSNTDMQVPAHIIARMEARKADPEKRSAALDAVVSDVFAPKISTRASRFRLVDSGVETVVGIELDVVIVGVNPRVSKTYYKGPYDPNATDKAPDCSSDDGIRPDARIQDPVCDNCANCPMNVVGSKITEQGKKIKACSDHRYLAVVAAADPGKVYSLSVPVSGMTALREYFKHLSNYGTIPEEVVTTLSFDDKESYPKLLFKLKGFLQEAHIAKVEELAKSDATKIATRELTDPNTALPAPAPAGNALGSAAPAAEVAAEAKAAVTPIKEAPPAAPVAEVAPAVVETAPEPEEAVAETPVVSEDATPAAEVSDDLDAVLDNMFKM